jgi:glycosyltransferase involved in cell wall biosynthesis
LRVLAVLIRTDADDEIGGSERSFVELGNALVEMGVEVDAVEIPPSVSTVVTSHFNHYSLDSTSRRPRLLIHTLETLRIALNRRCQVVFAPTVYWPESLFVALVTHLILRRPLFVGLAGPFLEHQDRLQLADLITQWLKGKRGTRLVFTAFLRRLTVRASIGVVVPTGQLAFYARNTLRAKNAVVIGRGVDGSWFEPGSSDSTKVYDAIFVGRLHNRKGVDTLLEAWKVVSDSLANGRLLVVGSGTLSEELERRAQEMGLGNLVTFAGYVRDANEIRRLLRSSRLLVLPSEGEGFARVVAEAMACGVPCIISDLPGLRELYDRAAVFVPCRDPVRLAEAISALLLDDAKREELSRKSLALARTFRWNRVAALTYETFERALEQ